MATMINRHKKTSVTIIAVAALAAVLVVAGTAASVGSDHMAFARKITSARSSTTTTSHPSNSGIKVLNISNQRNLKCSTAG
jgi:outer membrane lipoprotein-sorting protein